MPARRPPSTTTSLPRTYAFCKALIAGGRPDDASYEAAREALGLDGVMELVTLVGYYTLLAQLMETFDVGVPTGETSPF